MQRLLRRQLLEKVFEDKNNDSRIKPAVAHYFNHVLAKFPDRDAYGFVVLLVQD